jgi:putative ABC transport system permease protein
MSNRAVFQYIPTALGAVVANRMRSFLTMLGVAVGIAAMTSVTSLLQGFRGQVNDEFESMGTSTIYIQRSSGPSMGGGAGRMREGRPELEVSYSKALEQVDGVAAVTPVARTFATVKTADGVEMSIQLIGTSQGWLDAGHRSVDSGRFMTEFEVTAGQDVCVIGAVVSQRLFGEEAAPGKRIEVQGVGLTVIGTLSDQGQVLGESQDNVVIIPYTVFQKWENLGRSLELMVEIESPSMVDSMVPLVESVVRRLRGLGINDDNNFDIMTSSQLQEGFSSVSKWLFIGLLGLSGLSLLIGSVGIANIMLVSVAQRTREIGLRMALGAEKHQIMHQFITESAVLSMVGGFAGIAAGAVLAGLISAATGIPSGMEPWAFAVAFTVSLLVGVAAGVFPAARAASMEPVKALSR